MDNLVSVAEATLQNFCDSIGIDMVDITDERAKTFFTKWVEKREAGKRPIHPQMLKKLAWATIMVLDRVLRPIPISTKNEIKNTAYSLGAKIYSDRLVLIKKANGYSIKTILPIINGLWNEPKVMDKQSAIILALNYATGARTSESLNLRWEDMRRKANGTGSFLQIFVRAGKCNKLPNKNELLTALVGNEALINLNFWLERWRPYAPNPNTGKKSSNRNRISHIYPVGNIFFVSGKGDTGKMVYRWNRKAKQLHLPLKLGGHSGRNHAVIACFQAKVPLESMRSYFRWGVASCMPSYYRSVHLETADTGAAAILASDQFNKKTEIQSPPYNWSF